MTNSEQNKKDILIRVPALRFPEFLEGKEWQEKQLYSVCQMKAGKFISASKINTQHIEGLYPCYGGNGLRGFTSEYSHSGEYSLIGRQGALCGNVNFVTGRFYATEHAVVVSPNKKINNNWLFYCLNKLNLNQYAIGQAQPGLSVNFLEKIVIQIPEQEKEQQKIADCLSSLDNVISLQAQKIDALHHYKNGMMQKLFPEDGEKIPGLRFSEFKNEGGWEEKKFNDIAIFFKGKGISKSDIVQDGKIQCIRYGELYTHYNETINTIISKTDIPESELFLSRQNDVIIPSSGETKWDIATASCVMVNKVALGSDLNIIRTNENGVFISYYLNSAKRYDISKIAQGDTVVHLYSSQLKLLNLLLPPKREEQQKIADCLSSLDKLINTEIKKLASLKNHKTGLMQQLFPEMDEVNA